MKLTTLALVIFSLSVFAEPLPKEEARLVLKAVDESFQRVQLPCKHVSYVNGSEQAGWVQNTKSFALENMLSKKDLVVNVFVDEQSAQPVIKINIVMLTDGQETRQETALVTTNDSFTEVMSVDYSAFSIAKVSRNAGTLTKPRFEIVELLTPTSNITCK